MSGIFSASERIDTSSIVTSRAPLSTVFDNMKPKRVAPKQGLPRDSLQYYDHYELRIDCNAKDGSDACLEEPPKD